MATYKVQDLPGFEHLLAVGELQKLDDGAGEFHLVEIEQLVNTSVLVGDRELKLTIRPGSLWINVHNLVEVPDAEAKREFATDNPFGEFKYSGRFEKERLVITHAVYENAININIVEKNPLEVKGLDSTIYSDNFFSTRDRAAELVKNTLEGIMDPEDLIFALDELKEEEKRG